MDYSRSLALVIGLDIYQALPRLPGAARSAEAMALTLRRLYRFEVSALYNQQATRGAVTRELDRLQQAERIIVYYAGRSANADTLALYNTDPDAPATGINVDRLIRQLDALPARHILVMLDAALEKRPGLADFAPGSAPITERFEGRARLIIGAGTSAWQSRERWGDDDASMFTAQMLHGLRGNAANANGAITGDLLAEYLIEELPRTSQGRALPWVGRLPGGQVPDLPGDMLFREVAPLELPREITDGLKNGFPSLRYRSVAQIATLIDRGDLVVVGLAIAKLREVAAENDSLHVRTMAADELIVRNIDPDSDGLPVLREPPPPRPGSAPPPEPSTAPMPPEPGERRQRFLVLGVMLFVAATVGFLIWYFR